ncbi:MAG TPA: hypothetical protein VEO56_06815 [Bacteroidota bacterium]|nr:hypothetical protein [Bacteroidota bacterium]
MNDVIAGKADGTVEVYPVTMDQAWEIALAVFHWGGCETIEEHRTEGYMLTSTGGSFVTSGSLMGAWIEPEGDSKVKVTVVSKRRVAASIASGLSESSFQSRFAQAVDIIKSGANLPLQPPAPVE